MSRHRRNEYGQSWSIAAALLGAPKTQTDLIKHYRMMTRRFGIYMEFLPGHHGFHSNGKIEDIIKSSLVKLISDGWIKEEGGLYALEPKGRGEAEKMISELEKNGRFLRAATEPARVSRVTLIVHAVLAVIKLPAAVLSGSVGLLNDGLDTLLDSIASLLVYWGIKKDRERLVSLILLLFMFITGLYSCYEAVKGLISGNVPEPDFLAFGAMALSALLCGGLWLYQKFSGLKHQSFPLLTQSVDSLNHVIVAGGVALGLIASLLKIPYLDSIVGLVVAAMILKGAAELLITLVRTGKDEDLDLSSFGFTGLDKHRRRQLKIWLLYRADREEYESWESLRDDAMSSLNFKDIAAYRALGIAEGGLSSSDIEEVLSELEEQKLIEEGDYLSLSADGREAFSKGRNKLQDRSRLFKVIGFILSSGVSVVFFYGLNRLLLKLQLFLPEWPGSSFSITGGFKTVFLTTGLVLFIAGAYLQRSAGHHLHHSRLDLKNPEATSLAETGPYSLVRHPMYVSFMLITGGIGFSLASLWGFIITLLFFMIMIVQAAVEDGMIKKELPEAHKIYKDKTPALILPLPGVIISVILLGMYAICLFF